MSGLIGRKIGMTSIFDENGKNIPCTLFKAGPCVVTSQWCCGYRNVTTGFSMKNETFHKNGFRSL
jgi:large subunit ribosomal protein L3